MSLLEPFTKPRWQHPKAEVRLAALEDLDDLAVLTELTRTDPDDAVRAKALERLSTAEALDELIDNPPDSWPEELDRQARAQRLEQLLQADGELPADAGSEMLLRIAELTEDPSLCELAIGKIGDAAFCAELARQHPQARVRLQAARGLTEIESLQSLMQHARHKDKAVFRYCREQLDAHHAEQRAIEERSQNLARLADEAAALRAATDSPDYRARFKALEERWSELQSHADPGQGDRIRGDLEICARRIEQHEAEQAAVAQTEARISEAAGEFAVLLRELEQLDEQSLASPEGMAAIEARLNAIEERWVLAMQVTQPEPDQTESCKTKLSDWRALLQTLQRLQTRDAELERFFHEAEHCDTADFNSVQKLRDRARRLCRTLPWPEERLAVTPGAILRIRQERERFEQRLDELRGREQKTLQKVDAALANFREELSTSHYRNADRALNRLRNLLRQLPSAPQNRYQQELKPLLARLQEIHDWQGFAIEPKKRELIEAMKALADSPDDPDTLAAKIKALQEDWKQLGPISPRRDQALWKKFRAAADEAWLPCKEAFGQRAELREQHYEKRMQVVAQLVEYEQRIGWPDREDQPPDLPAPDWKMVRKTLNTARNTFRELSPVDRKRERKSQKALDKVCNRIYAHLEKEYQRNLDAKAQLVAEARALAEEEDLKRAVERAKALQQDWKSVGLTPQRADRPLWKQFRSACDAVFERLGEERQQRRSEAHARQERRRAEEQVRSERVERKKRDRQERWQRLLRQMEACAFRTEDEARAIELWGDGNELPDGIDGEALAAWWQQGSADDDPEGPRQACIGLEVLAGIDSPPEEKQARMAFLMQRLVEGMGAEHIDDHERLRTLVNQFIGLRPPREWVQRFAGSIEAARARVR